MSTLRPNTALGQENLAVANFKVSEHSQRSSPRVVYTRYKQDTSRSKVEQM